MLTSVYRRMLSVLFVLAIFLGTLFSLPLHAEDIAPISFHLDFAPPINISLSYPHDSEAGKEELTTAIKSITQPVFDSLIRDEPLAAMWMDILNCNIFFSFYPNNNFNNINRVSVTSFYGDLAILPAYVDPKGMTDQVNAVLDSFTPSGNTMYERVKSIHDFVCLMTEYDATSPYPYSAYGSLVYRRAVCEGYAEAFKLLCNKNGIDCVLVSGVAGSENENHMWTYVRMDDNRWYAVDPTWDDGRGTSLDHSYFLIGSETVLRSGSTFADSHHASGDISATGYFTFTYPELTVNAYLTNHPDGNAGGDYVYEESEDYFYKQLTGNEQRAFYNTLRQALIEQAPSFPDATPTPAPTDDMVTTKAETTTSGETTQERETTATETTLPTATETTAEETSAASSEITTVPQTTVDTSSALTTDPPQTTAPPSHTPTSHVPSESLTQSTPAPAVSQSESLSSKESSSTPLSTSTSTGTASITVSPPPVSSPQGTSMLSLLDTLRVVVIVLALLTVFVLVSIVLIKTQSSDNK